MTVPSLKVDPAKCIGCAACVNDCIARALAMQDQLAGWAPDGQLRCIRCQHCFAICPTGALSFDGRDPAQAPAAGPLPEADAVLRLMQNRRSCRGYKQAALDPGTLRQLLAVLSWTPTGVNDHRLHFAVIDSLEAMNAMRDHVYAMYKRQVRTKSLAPAVERFAGFYDAVEDGADILFRHAPHLIVASTPEDAPCAAIDPVIALSYFELYAASLGVGTTWCGLGHAALKHIAPEMLDKLGVPDRYLPGYMMLFGPPAVEYARGTLPEPAQITLTGEI